MGGHVRWAWLGITIRGRGTDLCDGDVEVEFEGEDGSREEHHKHHKGSILKVRQLDLHRTKLHPPADAGVRGRGLEPHALPVSGLNILEEGKEGKRVSVSGLNILEGGKEGKRVSVGEREGEYWWTLRRRREGGGKEKASVGGLNILKGREEGGKERNILEGEEGRKRG